MSKQCSQCDARAELSLCFLASTVGRPERLQKCSAGTALCKSCMQSLLDRLGSAMPSAMVARLRAAYTVIDGQSVACLNPSLSLGSANRRGRDDAQV